MARFKDLPAAQIGRYGEKIVGRLLRATGAGVIATLKFSGENDNEAPALEFEDRRITIADFDVSMRGRTFSLEAKTYKEPQFNRTHQCRVHGISAAKVEMYCAQERERGIPVHIGILEVDSGCFIVSDDPISKIEPRYPCLCGCENDATKCEFRRKGWKDYPQWYFRRDSFREWSRLEGADLDRLQREHGRVSHALRKHRDGEPAPRSIFNPYPINKEPWSFACLACNQTWRSGTHRCDPKPYLIAYWTRRLQYAHVANAEAIVRAPIARTDLVAWFGANWSPERDAS